MDQLNRGVKVEGLTLPPGITLTRVDPNSAEGMRAKKEAISRVRSIIIIYKNHFLLEFFFFEII